MSDVDNTWTLRLVDSNNDEINLLFKNNNGYDTFNELINAAAVKFSKVPDFSVSVESAYMEIVR